MTDMSLLEYEGRVLLSDPEFRVVVLGDDIRDLGKCVTFYWGGLTMPETQSWVSANIDPLSIGTMRDVLSWESKTSPPSPCSGYVATAQAERVDGLQPSAVVDAPVQPATEESDSEISGQTVAFRDWLSVTVKLLNGILKVRGK